MNPEPPRARTLPQLLADAAAAAPAHEALVAGQSRLTYAELATASAGAAGALASLEVGDGDCVALLAPNIAEWIPVAIGAQALGARVDAFNTWVKAYDLEFLLASSQAKVLVMVASVRNSDLLAELGSLVPEMTAAASTDWASSRFPALQHVVVIGEKVPAGAHRWSDLVERTASQAQSPEPPELLERLMVEPSAHAEAIAFVLYTSGSTSKPKAVPLAHRDLIVNGFQIGERMGLGPQDRVWFGSPLFWSFGCANALMATMTHQGCFVLQEQFEARAALELMIAERVNAAYLLPAMTDALAREVAEEMRGLATLRTGVTIGRPDEVERAAVTLGVASICNVYGATENYGNCCVTDHRLPLAQRLVTQGPPLPGVQARVVDEQSGRTLPPGEPGELHVRGRVTPGYLNDDEANSKAFTADGWYRTGDRMVINADGSVTYIGRLTDMIKTSGINVSPAEVESFLATHPDVAEAVVLGAPHPTRDQVVVAFVVPRSDALSSQDVIDYCRRNIAGYKVPYAVAVVASIPKTGTGKLVRRNLLDTATSLVTSSAGPPGSAVSAGSPERAAESPA